MFHKIKSFISNWVYPGYYLKNILYNRYDLIKVPQIKSWQYQDIDYLMLCANMELIVRFVEKEHGLEIKDLSDDYDEYKSIKKAISEIYEWWTIKYPNLLDDKKYLEKLWKDYILGKEEYKLVDGYYKLTYNKEKCVRNLEEFTQINGLRTYLIDKYVQDWKKLLNEDWFYINVIKKLDDEVFEQQQKYLHMCIDVRPYLWT